jgi:hypothetical protein
MKPSLIYLIAAFVGGFLGLLYMTAVIYLTS